MLLKAQIPFVMVMVAAIGAMLGVGCEKHEPETPPQATQSRLQEDATESPQNEDTDIIKGHVVALLDACTGNMMVISVENDTAIGTNQDLYGNNCFRINRDTLFVYDNVIGLPLPFDYYYNNEYRYIFNGDTLRNIGKNDYFEFKCQPVVFDSEEYPLLFDAPVVCPANLDGPSNMNLFKITEIKKYIKI